MGTMFAVDHVLVSDAVLDAPFACHLGRCLGSCCVHGDRGAPLDPDERQELDRALPVVRERLRPEALAVIDRDGVWEEDEPGHYATTTVNDRECVFVIYDRAVAKCALQQAYRAGRLAFEKPISCHLYPIRIETYPADDGPDTDVVNYEQIDLCRPAIKHGARTNTQLADFLETPLTRKYGADWYRRFRAAVHDRVATLNDALRR
ncbi:MAG: DUF3109 family protein [Bacteroidota bacterium]